jgi:hypothetical protein
MNLRLLCLAVLSAGGLLLSAQVAEAAEDDDKPSAKNKESAPVHEGLAFNAEVRQRMGLITAVVPQTNLSSVAVAFGLVLDPSPLALLDAELDGALAALAIARAQEARERLLFEQNQIVAQPALEAALLLVRADETRYDTALRRLTTEWGDPFVQLDSTNRHRLIRQLLSREVILLRVELPAGESITTNSSPVHVRTVDAERVRRAEIFSEAPTVDARTQGQAFLLRVPGPDAALRPGAVVTAQFTRLNEAAHGRLLPRSAVVRHLGHAWVYLAVKEDTFEHRQVTLDRLTEDGWFTTTSELPEDARVVTTGAQLLLSEELKARFAGE